ncbi:MAG: AAA family ATPase [Candidatus Thermoplasmatota archaeon]
MVVILLAGMPGAGKEEFLKIAKKKGFDIVRMGDIVREQAEMADLSKQEISIGEFANKEREEHHEGIWADRTLSKVSGEETVIDGIRSAEEVNIFKSELEKNAPIVAIHSSPKTRFERLKERGREDAPQTRTEFHERDRRELDWGMGNVIARADQMIVNEGTLSDFQKKAAEVLDDIKSNESK